MFISLYIPTCLQPTHWIDEYYAAHFSSVTHGFFSQYEEI